MAQACISFPLTKKAKNTGRIAVIMSYWLNSQLFHLPMDLVHRQA